MLIYLFFFTFFFFGRLVGYGDAIDLRILRLHCVAFLFFFFPLLSFLFCMAACREWATRFCTHITYLVAFSSRGVRRALVCPPVHLFRIWIRIRISVSVSCTETAAVTYDPHAAYARCLVISTAAVAWIFIFMWSGPLLFFGIFL